jgi:hypothetical protein
VAFPSCEADGPLSCKQVLTIALAVVLFDLHISPTNGIGILLTLIGGVSPRVCACGLRGALWSTGEGEEGLMEIGMVRLCGIR